MTDKLPHDPRAEAPGDAPADASTGPSAERVASLVADLRRENAGLRRREARLQHEVRLATERLRRLTALGREVTASLDLDATLQFIAAGSAELLSAPIGLLFFVEEPRGSFRCRAAHGLDLHQPASQDEVITDGLLVEAMSRHATLRLGPDDLAGHAADPLVRLIGGETAVIARLEIERHVIALLVVAGRRDAPFTDEDAEHLMLFGMQAANAIGNARVHQKLKELDRLRSDFVAMVSHEIRTPLTAILGTLDILLDPEEPSLHETQRELLEICVANSKRLLAIVNDILDFSRLQQSRLSLNFRPVNLAATIRGALRSMERLAGDAGVRLITDLADHLPTLEADEDRVTQVLTNLISNAIKFSPEGGAVRVGASRSDDGVRVSVRDEGCGIAAEDMPKLFKKFTQLDTGSARRTGGTGLGLVISHGIVTEHGGRIWVESAPGKGSTFHFTLPLRRGGPGLRDAPRPAKAGLLRGERRAA